MDPRRTLRIQLERIDGKRPPPSQIKVEPQAPPLEQDPQAAPGLVCTCILLFLAVPVGSPQLSVTSNLFRREALSTNHTCMYQFLCSLPSMPSLRQSRGGGNRPSGPPLPRGSSCPQPVRCAGIKVGPGPTETGGGCRWWGGGHGPPPTTTTGGPCCQGPAGRDGGLGPRTCNS